MHGSFNGIPLKNISSLKTTTHSEGFKQTSFRVLDGSLPKLEQMLQLKGEALLILSSDVIEGRIIHYSADVHSGYEITIESKKRERGSGTSKR